ncbi:MAG: hydrogenase expression/formation protein [candidate division Zixibacteria bacterium]|nr:hydrogenase expression/formation protein [candidate division Zixibacteria bacterium]
MVGPGIGLDAAVIRIGGRVLVAKTDPITFVADEIGTYALLVNANDLAAMGATPKWFLATVMLPACSTTISSVKRLFAELHAACRRLHVSLCGGHSEITDAVARPVVVGCLLGECAPGKIVTAAGARVGDAVLLTKGLAIEAVSILARERADEIRRRHGARFLARCRRYLTKPGLSVLKEAQVAVAVGGVHAMHDPTEGGLSSALYELAEAANVGLKIEADTIHILPEAAQLCSDFWINPLGVIASGALLISIDQAFEGRTLARLRAARIPATRIGTVVPRRNGVTLIEDGRACPFPRFAVDELARFFQRSRGG